MHAGAALGLSGVPEPALGVAAGPAATNAAGFGAERDRPHAGGGRRRRGAAGRGAAGANGDRPAGGVGGRRLSNRLLLEDVSGNRFGSISRRMVATPGGAMSTANRR